MTSAPSFGPPHSAPRWWVARDGAAHGPYDHNHLVAWLQNRQLDAETLMCPEGGQQWRPARSWPIFAAVIPAFVTDSFQPPLGAAASPNPGDERQHIERLKSRHRLFTLGILGLLAANVLVAAWPLLLIPVLACQLGLCVGLASALRLTSAWLWAFASVFPCAGMLALLALSRKATGALQAAGVEVGLLGPRS